MTFIQLRPDALDYVEGYSDGYDGRAPTDDKVVSIEYARGLREGRADRAHDLETGILDPAS